MRRLLILAVLLVFALALVSHAWPAIRARSLPTGEAEWIWKPRDRKDHNPTAFYAIRDFDLGETPPERARLLVTADEEYVATLNGKRVGAGCYQPGAPLDAYEVGPLLLPGGNRLLIELRSGRGAGGLLASLTDTATGRRIAGTDRAWRIHLRHELGLVRGWMPINGGEPAITWGYPPIGRWGAPQAGPDLPLLARDRTPPVPAASALPAPLPDGLGRQGRPPGSPVLYDWGRPVSGRLSLDLPPGEMLGVGLLFTGETPPDPMRDRPAASVLILPGRHDWLDVRPRRFRYALLVGLVRPVTASVLPGAAAPPLRGRPEDDRVFGVQGPPLRTPVEDEVWSKLQRLPGVARREEL